MGNVCNFSISSLCHPRSPPFIPGKPMLDLPECQLWDAPFPFPPAQPRAVQPGMNGDERDEGDKNSNPMD
jgi:hypothetical protein